MLNPFADFLMIVLLNYPTADILRNESTFLWVYWASIKQDQIEDSKEKE